MQLQSARWPFGPARHEANLGSDTDAESFNNQNVIPFRPRNRDDILEPKTGCQRNKRLHRTRRSQQTGPIEVINRDIRRSVTQTGSAGNQSIDGSMGIAQERPNRVTSEIIPHCYEDLGVNLVQY